MIIIIQILYLVSLLHRYRDIRNKVVQLMREAKSKYFVHLTATTLDSKKFWSSVKKIRKPKSSLPSQMSLGDKNFVTSSECVAELNLFFNSSYNNAVVEPSFSLPSDISLPSSFLCDEECVLSYISSLRSNASCGSDMITAKLLKLFSIFLAPSLCKVFNQSLEFGKLPVEWKHANVTPIPKNDNRSLISNYRPISLLSIPSKLLERHVYNLLLDHLNSKNFLSEFQFGFRSKRGTTNALLCATHDWHRYLEMGKDVCVVFFDFAKAFDSVPHQALLNKLAALDVHPSLLSWLSDYLDGRTQCTVADGVSSSVLPVPSGVPQGSVLGPLLFAIYVNDLPAVSSDSTSQLFADDHCLYRPLSHSYDLELIQDDINAVSGWSAENHLRLNRNKTKYMIISRKKKSLPYGCLLLDGLQLEQVRHYKYLGVIVNDNLTWSDHIDSVTARSRRLLGFLYRTFYSHCGKDAFVRLYRSLVLPILDYASIVWDPHLVKDIKQLESVQTFACRLATRSWSASSHVLLQLCHLVPLSVRRSVSKLTFLYKCVSNLTFVRNDILLHRVSGSRRLHNLQLICPFSKTNSFKYSYFCSVIVVWNSLPSVIVHSSTLSYFKTQIINYLTSV